MPPTTNSRSAGPGTETLRGTNETTQRKSNRKRRHEQQERVSSGLFEPGDSRRVPDHEQL